MLKVLRDLIKENRIELVLNVKKERKLSIKKKFDWTRDKKLKCDLKAIKYASSEDKNLESINEQKDSY